MFLPYTTAMSHTATRLITLIMLLQRQPNQRAADLAVALDVSERTLHRYMGMLEEMGIPIYSERGRNGGFSLARGYRMPPLVFTPEEATAVHLGTSLVSEIWGKLYEEAAHGALAKLDNVLPEEQRQEIAWASRALIATNMNRTEHVILMPLLEKLRQATRERRRVRIWYQGRQQPDPVERELDVYALVYSWGWWYAIGFCHLRQSTRSFRVDRMNDLILLGEPFAIPDTFEVHDYLSTEPPEPMNIQVTMRFQPEGVFLAEYGRSYWDSMEIQPDGSLIVTFGAQDMNYAASTIMSYGPLVEALEPGDLREILREWATAVAGQYKNKQTKMDGDT
ncbi:MAG: YafY family transcriptional regulator [Anaerolineae bacterium]|nr:YafY family transcriptional regulator [Anaerolineae bacterium]